jgi:hypothetical protein
VDGLLVDDMGHGLEELVRLEQLVLCPDLRVAQSPLLEEVCVFLDVLEVLVAVPHSLITTKAAVSASQSSCNTTAAKARSAHRTGSGWAHHSQQTIAESFSWFIGHWTITVSSS